MSVTPVRHVVIVGVGFGGLRTARHLDGASIHVTLIDRYNFHLFQPLLYQVATAGLSPADIAYPIRSILKRKRNVECLMAEVTGIDPREQVVFIKKEGEGEVEGARRSIHYDYLVLATGSSHSYFGHDEWERYAPGLKTVRDATEIRRRILTAFELAEMESDPVRRKELLRFAIVGGGPTGVELAGSISELARRAVARDFRHIDPRASEILIIEAGPRILAGFPPDLSDAAKRELEKLGVTVLTNSRVTQIDAEGVTLEGKKIRSASVIWAAGVVASPAGRWLCVETDRAGRVKVLPDLSVPGYPDIFVIGDTCTLLQDGKPLPGVAPVAMQMGKYVAQSITRRISGRPDLIKPFRYLDKGNLATVGRSFAVADIRNLHLKGFFAWLTWLVVHIFYLIGFRNRIVVLIEWGWAYLTFQRGARLIVPADGEVAAQEQAAACPPGREGTSIAE